MTKRACAEVVLGQIEFRLQVGHRQLSIRKLFFSFIIESVCCALDLSV